MANNNSTCPKPAVQNNDSPFSELFKLLPQLNAENSPAKNTIEQAIATHCNNIAYVLINGLQSLGVLLAVAADHDDNRLAKNHIVNVGWLIQALNNLLENCIFLKESIS